MDLGNKISGFILAGGKSSRMGSDKALLIFQGMPLLSYMTCLIKPFCEIVSISGQNSEFLKFEVIIVPDLYSDCGPISGIYSCLMHSERDWNFMVSVDAPFVNEELLSILVSNIGEFDCVIPEHASGIEPLIGLYHKRILPLIEEMIKNEDYKLMNMISKLNTRFVNCDDLIKIHPRLFMNINSPEDFESI
jgi:molybdopterin-guanine dinucleotide biosynthesis protein A